MVRRHRKELGEQAHDSVRTLQDSFCPSFKREDVVLKALKITDRMFHIEGFPDYGASRLQDRYGALTLRYINTDCT